MFSYIFTFMEKILKLVHRQTRDRGSISDADYAEELQLQEALEASLSNLQISQLNNNNNTLFGASKELGESSRLYCDICMEEKERYDMIKLESCSHSFCSDCLSGHIQAKVENNIHLITCPDSNCNYIIEPDFVKGIIPDNVLVRWEKAWSEATILDSEKFYCPYKDCSAMLVNDAEEEIIIRESECPVCRRLICARCYVPWHFEFECEEFQKLKMDERENDDLKMHALARENKWTKCPNCKFLIDKNEGCIHMTCRCGFEFCYICGLNWNESHWSCQTNDMGDN